MKKLIPSVLTILIFAIILGLDIYAQDKTTSPSGFVLEITYYKGKEPAHQAFTGTTEKTTWAWYSLFRRVEGFKSPANMLPVRAVNIDSVLENDIAKVQISVLTGESVKDKKEFVANYTLRENEKISVGELTKFGVEPFEISLIRNTPTTAYLPSVSNKTTSLEVSLEPLYETLPAYTAAFLNNSSKAVVAFSWELTADGMKQKTGMPQRPNGGKLIEPGETLEVRISGINPTKQAASIVLQITAVIFEDGTYEGNPYDAGFYRAAALGRKLQVQNVISLLAKAQENEVNIAVIDKLIEQVSALPREVDEIAFQKLLTEFPTLSEKEKTGLRSLVAGTSNGIRIDLRNELQAFRENSPTADAIRAFLSTKKQQYQTWLSNLP
jgi:hypothetical protein